VRLGADKISINTAVIRSPILISEIAKMLGSQAVVIGVEAKSKGKQWQAMTDCGRENTGRDVLDWVQEVQELGAGEILLTSIDREGTKSGFDIELIREVRAVCSIPIIAHGGAGRPIDAIRAHDAGADGVAIASILHSGQYGITDIKSSLLSAGIKVRE
jgi:cyclase